MSDVKKQCHTCQWYLPAVLRSEGAGQVKIRVCTNTISEHSQTMSGPQNTCDKWALARRGV